MIAGVDLLVPVKPLWVAKSRLRGAVLKPAPPAAFDKPAPPAVPGGDQRAHRELALALVRDTIAAARAAHLVRRLLAICSDPQAARVLRADGAEVIPDDPDAGLNPALRHGAALLRAEDPAAAVGALQSDLPALRPAELDAAIAAFAALGGRAFCPDRAGLGSTMLLAAPGVELDPRFGNGSAAAHSGSGAHRLDGPWPSLRCDVDTEADLAVAAELGLGRHTRLVFR
jgi:2-phospho-L-lactate/phosphoenolpyruvate guanylyltransferase